MTTKNIPLNAVLLVLPVLALIVQRHASIAGVLAADNRSFKWEGLRPVQKEVLTADDKHHQNRQRRAGRTGGIKGGRHLQGTPTTTTTTTTTSTSNSSVGGHTPTFAQTAIKTNNAIVDNKSKFKLSKKEAEYSEDEVVEGERWCGWGRKNVVVHTVYDSRNIEDAKPNEWLSGLGFPFAVVSLVSGAGDYDDDDGLYDGKTNGAHQALNGGHWTQTVLAVSENIRIGHDELTFYQNTGHDNGDSANSNITGVMQEENGDMSPVMNKDKSVAGVITTQFDSALNVAIVTAGSGLFECAQGNPQVSFQEGSTTVTIVWDLCVCETAAIPPPPEPEEEEEEDEESLEHDVEPLELDPVLDQNHTTAAAAASPAARDDGLRN